jgi:hypothetical protein
MEIEDRANVLIESLPSPLSTQQVKPKYASKLIVTLAQISPQNYELHLINRNSNFQI